LVTGFRSWVLLQYHQYANKLARLEDALELNVTQVGVGNVPDENPSNFENSLPFIGGPDSAAPRVVDRCQHLSHPTEMARGVHAEEKVDGASSLSFLEGLVEAFVARFC